MTATLEEGEWSAARPSVHFTPGKEPVPILQEAGWAPGPVWTSGKSRPHRDSILDRPAHSQSLYHLSYPAHHVYGTSFLFSSACTCLPCLCFLVISTFSLSLLSCTFILLTSHYYCISSFC